MPHYHVLTGMRGYIPDYNEVFYSQDEALSDLVNQVEQILEHPVDPDGRGIGIPFFFPPGLGVEYAEVTECEDWQCLDDRT